jgi:hypothetical protein
VLTWQLMQTLRKLVTEWWQILWGSMGTGTKEHESRAGHVWASGFHHVIAHSRLAGVLKLMSRLFI